MNDPTFGWASTANERCSPELHGAMSARDGHRSSRWNELTIWRSSCSGRVGARPIGWCPNDSLRQNDWQEPA